MINKNTLAKSVIGSTTMIALIAGFALTASAQSTTGSSAALAKIIARGNTAITERIASLQKLTTRIGEMKNVSASEQSTLSSEVSTNSSNLTTLQAKIDADTDVTTAHADVKSITDDYRIYADVIPQVNIEGAADRITTIVGLMNTLETKLQTRITAAGSSASSLQSDISDMTAKLADATTQSQNAESAVVSITPDDGNSATAASNKTAIEGARADVKAGTADLKAARQDIDAIRSGLKNTSTTTTTSTTTQ